MIFNKKAPAEYGAYSKGQFLISIEKKNVKDGRNLRIRMLKCYGGIRTNRIDQSGVTSVVGITS